MKNQCYKFEKNGKELEDFKSFVKKINLSDFPGGYSYANGFIENNILYLAFEFNRHDIYFAKIDLEKD